MKSKQKVNRIDFKNSHLSWSGSSKGIFNIISTLKIKEKGNENGALIFALGSAVIAGNLYKNERLIKTPEYYFQVMGSESKQCIYRTFIDNNKKYPNWVNDDKTGDTFGKNMLNEFKLNITKEEAFLLADFTDIANFFDCNSFSAKISLKMNNKIIIIEFPIIHLNIKPQARLWQVETGPVLFPIINNKSNLFGYLPSFVHFNCFENIDIFYDFPFGIRSKTLDNGIMNGFPCKIKLYATN